MMYEAQYNSLISERHYIIDSSLQSISKATKHFFFHFTAALSSSHSSRLHNCTWLYDLVNHLWYQHVFMIHRLGKNSHQILCYKVTGSCPQILKTANDDTLKVVQVYRIACLMQFYNKVDPAFNWQDKN